MEWYQHLTVWLLGFGSLYLIYVGWQHDQEEYMARMTQKERVLKYLQQGPKDGGFFCYGLRDMGERPIPEYRTRISELEKEGYNIQRFHQDDSPYILYVLQDDEQEQLFPTDERKTK